VTAGLAVGARSFAPRVPLGCNYVRHSSVGQGIRREK